MSLEPRLIRLQNLMIAALALTVLEGLLGCPRAFAVATPGLGLAYTSVSFADSRFPEFQENNLFFKGDLAITPRSSPYELGIEGFATAIVLSSTTNMRPGFGGISAWAGVKVVERQTWWVTLAAGGAYSMMTSKDYGYDNISALVFRASIRRVFNDRSTVSLYLKYAPTKVTGGFSFTESGELASGVDFTFGHSIYHPRAFFIAADVSTYTLVLSDARITAHTMSVNSGFRFF